ncbi:MAG TPA: hypothetical protein ENK57_13005 [Polyangiaceae bacterium]|nr:hypothetical protein [Polyangiaceae bacterium]
MILRVHFDPPGFFLNDPLCTLSVDGRILYEGSFKSGFDVRTEVPPGDVVLETAIGGPVMRKQQIRLPLGGFGGYRGAEEVHARLSYSRMWGNFAKRAALSAKR